MELGEFQLDICLAIYYVPTVLCFQIANEDLKRVFLSRGSANIRGFGSVFLRWFAYQILGVYPRSHSGHRNY